MADADDVRRLALSLPDVEEVDSDGFDFRVGGKGFVWSFFTAPGYEGWPLVMLRLEAVDRRRLRQLVTDAWRMRAPD